LGYPFDYDPVGRKVEEKKQRRDTKITKDVQEGGNKRGDPKTKYRARLSEGWKQKTRKTPEA